MSLTELSRLFRRLDLGSVASRVSAVPNWKLGVLLGSRLERLESSSSPGLLLSAAVDAVVVGYALGVNPDGLRKALALAEAAVADVDQLSDAAMLLTMMADPDLTGLDDENLVGRTVALVNAAMERDGGMDAQAIATLPLYMVTGNVMFSGLPGTQELIRAHQGARDEPMRDYTNDAAQDALARLSRRGGLRRVGALEADMDDVRHLVELECIRNWWVSKTQ